MKLLLDENLPAKLRFRLRDKDFDTYTPGDMQWLGKENGELLRLMKEHQFTTFITMDNNISFQQNFINYPLQVIVLVATENTYETIMEIFPGIIEKRNQKFSGPQLIIHPDY